MVNYGYGKKCRGWKPERKRELYNRLAELLRESGYCVDFNDPNREGFTPYLELDSWMDDCDGVRIRAITHLSDEEKAELIRKADKIYLEVMER